MRTIKFRGKSLETDDWVYGFLADGNLICTWDNRRNSHEVLSTTVGQFTGLTDKNGREIYEGDVIQHRNEKIAVQFYRGAFGYSRLVRKRIRLTEGASRVEEVMKFVPFIGSDNNSNALMFPDGTVFDTDFCEVIGNIHDNPELLEKGGEQ